MKQLFISTTTVVLFLCLQLGIQAQITNVQLAEDLDYLKEQLQLHHPNLYVYSSPLEVDQYFDALKAQSSKSLTHEESYKTISSIYSIVKDGHLYFQPEQSIMDDFYATSPLIPIDIYWDDQNAYIVRNYSSKADIELGSKIKSINGIEVSKIKETITLRVLRDGDNTTYPMWILNNFFRAYHGFMFGTKPSYELELSNSDGSAQTVKLKGMTHTAIADARIEMYPAFEKEYNAKMGITLDIDSPTNSAILKIRSFDNRDLKSKYSQNFRKLIAEHFETIKDKEIDNLILDIRDNQGGHVTNGIYLLQHLINQPFQAVEGFSKVDKSNYDNIESRNRTVKGIGIGYNKPHKNLFSGQLYTLVNGGSFSCSGIVAHVLDKINRGILVGEETAGSAYTLVGEPSKQVTLPNCKIQVTIPTLQFILQDYANQKTSGTTPDIISRPSAQDMIENKDSVLEKVLLKISQADKQDQN